MQKVQCFIENNEKQKYHSQNHGDRKISNDGEISQLLIPEKKTQRQDRKAGST